MANRSINEMEANAAAEARKELAEPLNAAVAVLNLATKLQANDVPEERLPKTRVVRLLLLQRVQNDLRCCVILVERGYPLQAAALAAGIFEAWVTLANIRTDDDAVKWLSHTQENEGFGRIRDLTRQALKSIAGDAKDADKWYWQYQQLCMPKHLNPMVERARGYVLDGKSIEFKPGPDTSKLAIAQGWFALERACQFAHFALLTMAHSQEIPSELHQALAAQQGALHSLQEESAKRWPNHYSEDVQRLRA